LSLEIGSIKEIANKVQDILTPCSAYPHTSNEQMCTHFTLDCYTLTHTSHVIECACMRVSIVSAHSCRPKLVWGNQDPMWPINPATLKAIPTHRTCQLAQPKKNHRDEHMYTSEFEYSCGRTSQIWEVKEGAKKAIASNRTSLLARHKTVPVGYLEHR
jgi:hypothetical protein